MELKNKNALEASKFFPYIAWTMTFLFALFVYNITSELKNVTESLQEQTNILQEVANKPVHEIENFDI